MPDHLLFDRDLQKKHLLDLTSADAVAQFFAYLGYPVDERISQDPANLDIVAESTLRPIESIELLASFASEFQVYLFEVKSVTVSHRKALVRAFRNRAGNFLLVVTSNYDRIDFVLVESYEAPGAGDEPSPFRTTQRRVRPRAHTVDRRKPKAVDLRVLRRFTWTEDDGYAQHDKLRAAFDLSTWSEDEFNNRALFSDHYLKTRLRLLDDWKEGPHDVYRELNRLFRNARSRFGQADLDQLRDELLDPVLETLGFTPGPAPGQDGPLGRPLFASAGESPLTWCLDFPWGRSLDAKDPHRDPDTGDVNPGVEVVDLLEREDVGQAWVILTNGQIWRLYSRQAHSRATNYYEIDAEEVVSATSEQAAAPQEPFRYFWLLFRRQAFAPREFLHEGKRRYEPLLTRLWIESNEYAKKLGDRLKDKIFDEVFETLARGFLASRSTDEPPTQDELDVAFEGTLTFLYRLLFLLYAEARDLLPVREVRGYYKKSLSRLKKEVARHADAALSQVDEKLAGAYSESGTPALYSYLLELFEIIDKGAAAVNVPEYNGGLFLTSPHEEDRRPEARAAGFLRSHSVADLPLAQALDRLARNEDEKDSKLVFIDYKSLGVRQLGSIYEGLLEFRLRLASEDMAIVKGKKTDEVVPLAEARDKDLPIQRQGRGQEATERIIPRGEIYLENDKQERRATGSYYTPDFVVEYIVRKTVGPLLQEKLDALRPRLREAERWYQKRTKQASEKGEAAAKYESGEAVERRWQDLVSDAFDLKILDPAMGSGHFLVEAVDFVTDEILRFLRAFPWNPVFAHLQYLRDTILREMEAQDITIDADRLTDTHLLKRHVLKRCIFGVDVNPMAVELAKVSLWLDCFTLGAPLSFLNHHLRHGNSILGVSVEEAREVIDKQLNLFSSRFAGLQLATLSMIQVGAMPDVTSAQVAASRGAFGSASQELAPYLRLLHFFLAHVLRVTAKRKPPTASSPILELIRAPELEPLFRDQPVEPALEALPEKDRELVIEVLREAEKRAFFHWQLEFPEVFFTLRPGTERQIELDPESGFDAVVGNPPWIRQEALKAQKPVLRELFEETYDSVADVYVYLLTRGLQVLRPGGGLGMILQNKWFKATYGEALRRHLTSSATPLEVIDFGHAPLFDADTFPCVLRVEKAEPPSEEDAAVDFFNVEDLRRQDFPGLDLDEYGAERRGPVLLRRLRPEGWELLPKKQGDLMEKLRNAGPSLAEYVGQAPQYGIKTGYNAAFLVDQAVRDRLVAEDPDSEDIFRRYLRGQDVQRWVPEWDGQWLIRLASSQNVEWPWSHTRTEEDAEAIFKSTYPSLFGWMKEKEDRLRLRRDKGRYWWELRSCDYYELFERAKIVYKDASHHSAAAFDSIGLHAINTCYMIPSSELYLLACLNSSVAWRFFHEDAQKGKTDTFRLFTQHVEKLPIPEATDGQKEWISQRVHKIRELMALLPERLRLWDLSESPPHDMRAPVRTILRTEIELQQYVFELYELTRQEASLLRESAPPRDPLLRAERRLQVLSGAEGDS